MNALHKSRECVSKPTDVWNLTQARIRAHFNTLQERLPWHQHPHFELLYITKLGYDNHCYFYRQFRSVTGQTTTAYRAAARNR